MYYVSAVDCDSYDSELVFSAVKEALQRIGFELPFGKKVLIKPNIMTQNKAKQHTVTHPSIIDALCRLLDDNACSIFIGDSSAFYQKGMTRKAFETTGIGSVARKYGAELVPFEETPLCTVSEDIVGLDRLYMPKILFDVDMVIDACKLKTHAGMRFSGAVKNMFGCLPGGYKQKIHRWTDNEFELSDVFIDIHKVLKPALSIMDAVYSLDGGPTALGRPVRTGKIFASENPAALDIVTSSMIGYAPEQIPILLQARKRGLISDFGDIEILGEIKRIPFRHLVEQDLYRQCNRNGTFVKDTYVDLRIRSKKCTRCGNCMGECPVEAIEATDGGMRIDTEKCINCYYCLSLCKENAIAIDASMKNRGIRFLRKITGL